MVRTLDEVMMDYVLHFTNVKSLDYDADPYPRLCVSVASRVIMCRAICSGA